MSNKLTSTGSMSSVVATAVSGTVLIAAGAFWLSFTSLADLARRSGIAPQQAWAWPLIVDGIIVVATVAVVALSPAARPRATWYPWLLLASGAAVSVAANALHAVIAADASVPAVVAAARPDPSELPPTPAAPTSEASAVDQRDEAKQLRLDGMSNRAIARHLGVHPSTLGRWLAPTGSTPELSTAPITKEQ